MKKYIFKKQTNKSYKAYKKHKYYWNNLYKKERKKLFDNLNTTVSDNKTFWKLTKSYKGSNQGSFGGNIKLMLEDENKIVEKLNLLFSNAVKLLKTLRS